MGYLRLMNEEELAFGLPDDLVGTVYEAAKAGHNRGDFVSLCTFDFERGRYVQIDVCVYVPEIKSPKNGEKLTEDMHTMFLMPVFDGDKVPADQSIVNQLLHVMEETDGCIVFTRDDKLVLDADTARAITLDAERINPFEDMRFPNPGH